MTIPTYSHNKEQKQPAIFESKNRDIALFNPETFSQIERVAKVLSSGVCTVPKHFKGKLADCMAVASQAYILGINPFTLAQKTFLVHENLCYEAQLINAIISSSNILSNNLRYEYSEGWERLAGMFKSIQSQNGKGTYNVPTWTAQDAKGLWVKVIGRINGEKEDREHILYLSTITVKNSTLWANNPKQQATYQAIKEWSRLHAPQAMMGLMTADDFSTNGEIIDVEPIIDNIDNLENEVDQQYNVINEHITYEIIDSYGESHEVKEDIVVDFVCSIIDELKIKNAIDGLIETNHESLHQLSDYDNIINHAKQHIASKIYPNLEEAMYAAAKKGKAALTAKGKEIAKHYTGFSDVLKENGQWAIMVDDAKNADEAEKQE